MLHLYLGKKDHILVSNLLIAAKILIAEKWRSEEVLSLYEWQHKSQHVLLMNKLTAICRGKDNFVTAIDNFETVWKTIIEYWKQVRL